MILYYWLILTQATMQMYLEKVSKFFTPSEKKIVYPDDYSEPFTLRTASEIENERLIKKGIKKKKTMPRVV